MEIDPLKPSQIPQKLVEYDLAIGEQLNSGLLLKKDQGFHMLSVFQKLFMMSYLYDIRNKAEAYVRTCTDKEYTELDEDDKLKFKLIANAEWKKIENIMGGVRNMIAMMGVDVIEIVRNTRRLMSVKKVVLDRDGIEHKFDDGTTQMKATEFLAKISGNYSEEIDNINRTTINLNFGTNQPARPDDILSDNMEVIEGSIEIVGDS
jgi:hypothetical protein